MCPAAGLAAPVASRQLPANGGGARSPGRHHVDCPRIRRKSHPAGQKRDLYGMRHGLPPPRALKTRRYKAKSNKNGPYLRVLRVRFPQQRKMRPGRLLSGASRPHQAPPHAVSRHDMPSGNDGRHRFLSGGHPDMPESWDGDSRLTRRGGAAAPRRHRRPAAGPRPRRTPSPRHPSCSSRSARRCPPCRSCSA